MKLKVPPAPPKPLGKSVGAVKDDAAKRSPFRARPYASKIVVAGVSFKVIISLDELDLKRVGASSKDVGLNWPNKGAWAKDKKAA